jgi:hypothetical protein
MRHDALRRAIGAGVVIAAAATLFGNRMVGLTGASFNASATNTGSAFAGGWVGQASAATATASGYDVGLSWTPGTAGPVTGQTIRGTDNGTSSNCSGAAYSDFSFTLGAAVGSTTDANRAVTSPVSNGDWVCYQIVSTSATAWTQSYNLSALQVGLAATSVSIANAGGTANTVEPGDTIAITFNQRTNLTASSVKVCVFGTPDNTILIGDLKSGSNCGTASGDGYSIGKLTTSSTVGSAGARFTSSSVAVTTSSPWKVTITLGSGGTDSVASGATWQFTPSSSVKSYATTDQAQACTSGASTCTPTTSSSF